MLQFQYINITLCYAFILYRIVLDLVNQVRDVVFVNCIFSLGNPRGSGFRNEGYMGWSGEISSRATWERGGQDPITARRVPSK